MHVVSAEVPSCAMPLLLNASALYGTHSLLTVASGNVHTIIFTHLNQLVHRPCQGKKNHLNILCDTPLAAWYLIPLHSHRPYLASVHFLSFPSFISTTI
eukprot:scaffold197353_cov33-Tisochrysis_lutea.AAC.2